MSDQAIVREVTRMSSATSVGAAGAHIEEAASIVRMIRNHPQRPALTNELAGLMDSVSRASFLVGLAVGIRLDRAPADSIREYLDREVLRGAEDPIADDVAALEAATTEGLA